MLPPLLRSASQTALLGPVLPTHNQWTGDAKPRSSLKKALRKKLVARLSRHFAKRKGRYLLFVITFALASARLLVRSFLTFAAVRSAPHSLRSPFSSVACRAQSLRRAPRATSARRSRTRTPYEKPLRTRPLSGSKRLPPFRRRRRRRPATRRQLSEERTSALEIWLLLRPQPRWQD